MDKFIIKNWDRIPDYKVFSLVSVSINAGKLSDNGLSYTRMITLDNDKYRVSACRTKSGTHVFDVYYGDNK